MSIRDLSRREKAKTNLVDDRRLLLLPALLLAVDLLDLNVTLKDTRRQVPETDETVPSSSEEMRRGGFGCGGEGKRAGADGGDGSLVEGEGVEGLRGGEGDIGREGDGRDLWKEAPQRRNV